MSEPVKAKLAYLVSPHRNVFVITIQPEGSDEVQRFEISKAHLARIVVAGASFALEDTGGHL